MHTSQTRLNNMTKKELKQLVLGVFVVDSTKQLKEIVPAAKECDFRKKEDLKLFYVIHTRNSKKT